MENIIATVASNLIVCGARGNDAETGHARELLDLLLPRTIVVDVPADGNSGGLVALAARVSIMFPECVSLHVCCDTGETGFAPCVSEELEAFQPLGCAVHSDAAIRAAISAFPALHALFKRLGRARQQHAAVVACLDNPEALSWQAVPGSTNLASAAAVLLWVSVARCHQCRWLVVPMVDVPASTPNHQDDGAMPPPAASTAIERGAAAAFSVADSDMFCPREPSIIAVAPSRVIVVIATADMRTLRRFCVTPRSRASTSGVPATVVGWGRRAEARDLRAYLPFVLTRTDIAQSSARGGTEAFGIERSAEADGRSPAWGPLTADVWLRTDVRGGRATVPHTDAAAPTRVGTADDGVHSPHVGESEWLEFGVAGLFAARRRLDDVVLRPIRALRTNGEAGTAQSLHTLARAMRMMHVAPATGLLLWGPSGCGKTALGRALARAARIRFIHVGCAALLSRYVGDSEAALRKVFSAARSLAPCLLLLDDVDAIAGTRSRTGGSYAAPSNQEDEEDDARAASASRGTPPPPTPSSVTLLDRMLATLLNEMDGVGHARRESSGMGSRRSHLESFVLVVGTTSMRDMLDPALLRPGRLEVHVSIGRPDEDEALDLLRFFTRDIALSPAVELRRIARERVELRDTAADLRAYVTAATVAAVRQRCRVVHLPCVAGADTVHHASLVSSLDSTTPSAPGV